MVFLDVFTVGGVVSQFRQLVGLTSSSPEDRDMGLALDVSGDPAVEKTRGFEAPDGDVCFFLALPLTNYRTLLKGVPQLPVWPIDPSCASNVYKRRKQPCEATTSGRTTTARTVPRTSSKSYRQQSKN